MEYTKTIKYLKQLLKEFNKSKLFKVGLVLKGSACLKEYKLISREPEDLDFCFPQATSYQDKQELKKFFKSRMKCLFDDDNLWIYEYEKTRIEITSLEEISDKLLSGVNDVDSGGIFKVEKEFAIFQKLLSYPYICSKYFEHDQKSKIKTTNEDILEINKNIDLLKLFKKQPQDLKIKTYESIINLALIFSKYKYEDCLISCFEPQLYENLIQDKQVIKILDVFYSSILDSNFLTTSSFVVKLMNKLNIDILKPILFSELLSKFKKQIDENIKVNKLISSKSAEPQTTIVTSLVNKNNSLLASAFSSLNNLGLTKSNLLTVDKKITPELQYELDKYPFKLVLNVQKHDNWDRRILVLSLDVKEDKMNPSFLIIRLSQLFNIPVSPMPLIKKEEITGVERGCHFAIPISQDGYLLPENLILLIFSMVKFNVLSEAV